jgi:hypothetical protein
MAFDKSNKDQSLFKIFTFYNSYVNTNVPRYQNAVFRKFGFHVNYIIEEDFSHGDFLNHVCQNVTDTQYLIFFDVDCIPTSKIWIDHILNDLAEPRTIAGAAQTANHLQNGQNLYVSPFFFGISTAYLKELSYPDMRMTDDMDAGQNLTKAVLKNGGIVKYWWPTHIEKEEWSLFHPEHTKFGPGTTYGSLVYHAFFSRFDLSDRFIKKCKSILTFTDKVRFVKIPRRIEKIKKVLFSKKPS